MALCFDSVSLSYQFGICFKASDKFFSYIITTSIFNLNLSFIANSHLFLILSLFSISLEKNNVSAVNIGYYFYKTY